MGFYTKINFQGDCMLNNEKITLMTKLSLYEQKNQKKEIKTDIKNFNIQEIEE